MATTPDDILKFADTVLGATEPTGTGDEAAYRTVASRAYYSVFHLMRQHIGLGVGTRHKDVQDDLYQYGYLDEVDRVVVARLHWRTLIGNRVTADYELDDTVTRIDAEQSLLLAKEIFDSSSAA